MARAKRLLGFIAVVGLSLLTFSAGWIVAKTGMGSTIDPATLPALEQRFVEQMRGAAMIGSFTIAGREDRPARPDRYDIASVEKVGEDRWRFNARIGEVDITVPVAVTMRWVDDTPMIMLTDLAIPGLGTFTARVFFYGDRYAGTWQDETKGGHMFGRIERAVSPRANPK
jgi:hypothetical protein